jgi:RimJ/RimL family protein N-acetyltransferase
MSALPPLLHQGRSLSLRRTAPIDAPLLFQQMYRTEGFMRLFRLNDNVESEAQLRERLAQRLKVTPTQSGYLELLILHKQHGAIGVVSLADHSALHRRAEFLIGIFDRNYRHASYGLEAGLLIGDLAFNSYNLNRLYAYSYAYNDYAQQSLMASGFEREGIMKEHIYDRESQQFVDMHVYGMTLEHFRVNQRLARLSLRLVGRDITQPLPIATPTPIELETSPSDCPAFVKSGLMNIL